ncbi:MAG: DsbA family protein [Pseudomonadota bacterium]
MRFRAALQNKVAKHLFSLDRRDAKRRSAERKRESENAPHIVEYFHEAGDPYSHLLVQLLPEFCRRYEIELQVHIVPPPEDAAAPDRKRLETYSRRDAEILARQLNLEFDDAWGQPTMTRVSQANKMLVSAVQSGEFLQTGKLISQTLWSGASFEVDAGPDPVTDTALAESDERRDKLGHYLGATLYYAGEWYWGPDRLHYLERRLRDLGAVNSGAPEILLAKPPGTPSAASHRSKAHGQQLHWYLSFRSPYTGIVAERVKNLAEVYGAELKLRFVLPMVMRGMQVPRKKGIYIMKDVVREAERLGIPFGNIVDPVGDPVERGYAILHNAIEQGRGYEFVRAFLSGVWAEGIDAGTDRGLKQITETAGLSWNDVKHLIGKDDWRADAEANRQEMFEYGLWGVPSFRVGEVAVWGQDRLWVIEQVLSEERAA